MKLSKLKDDLRINKTIGNIKTVWANAYGRFFVWGVCLSLGIFSCESKKGAINEPIYEGPMLTMDSIYTKMSDSADIVLILKAPKQNNFNNGDREWPEGLELENMNKDGELVSTFRADYVFYTSDKNLYRAEGNIVVRSAESGDELNTEELFWNPSDEKFYTDRFVTIQSEDEVHTGEGLTANQDFSLWQILKPQGELLLDQE